ncbi:hypothetical protein [Flavobacterium lacus]|uniref:Uncharacterized protein n=1 Tax=Flavobacterium lacus TaxID=1353778 RepID=A0A328WXG9_9FLAO|nr:hypothetical protein [Flavobacterium lacus]RAR51050.1 hypothetical protein B0I10_101223 [Flavobacterium lacus]
MTSTSEVGHAKNVANFQDLIEFVTGYGATYNPSKNSLKLSELIALKVEAEAKLADVITKNTNYNNKVNERMIAFSNVKALSTRLVNALQTTEATIETINDAKTFNRKMQGKKVSATQTPTDTNAPAPATISTSQQSYDQLIQHLTGLKSVLESEPSYTPNETDLQIDTINAKITELTEKNTAVAAAYASVSNSRISRNETLYTNQNSIFETASEVKNTLNLFLVQPVRNMLRLVVLNLTNLDFNKNGYFILSNQKDL